MGVGKSAAEKTPTRKSSRGRPLVVIRFDGANVNYEQALYTAVNRVLQRQPDSRFNLVAVSSVKGGSARAALNSNQTRRNAQNVLRSLVDMGLPPSRVSLSATSSSSGSGNEVHLYLR
jgi:Mrp family chromosome partitioning ATPase